MTSGATSSRPPTHAVPVRPRRSTPPGASVSTFDGAGRLTRTTHPDGAFVTATYTNGSDGLPSVVRRDELSHDVTTLSDVDGNVTTVRERNGTAVLTTRYEYDVLGRLVKWTDAAGNSSTASYNSLGRKTAMADMDMGAWSYEYDNGGLLTRQTDARNQATTFGYDALGRPTIRTGQAQVTRWFYDESGRGASVGRLTRATYPAGSDNHTYNSLGLETSSTRCVDAVCTTLGSAYDPLRRPVSITYPDGEVVGYGYAADGQLTSVSGYVTAMAWSPAGQLTSMTYANGTVSTFGYDPDRLWLETASVSAGATVRYQASYAYNAAGLGTSITQGTPTAAATTYTYDDLNRLTSVGGAQNQTFTYNAIGDITSNSSVGAYAYGDPAHKHAVTSAGGAGYTYDANGNLTAGAGRLLA